MSVEKFKCCLEDVFLVFSFFFVVVLLFWLMYFLLCSHQFRTFYFSALQKPVFILITAEGNYCNMTFVKQHLCFRGQNCWDSLSSELLGLKNLPRQKK